jgi:hypothetical protein
VAVKESLAHIVGTRQPSQENSATIKGWLALWGSLVEAGVSPASTVMAEAAGRLWEKIDATWEDTFHNPIGIPYSSWIYAMFLVELIASKVVIGAVPLAQERLLHIILRAPKEISICAKILDPKYWGALWQPFVDQVWKYSGGGDSSDPVSARLGTVELLRSWLAQSGQQSTELSPDLGFLVDATLLAVLDDSPIIANHAAYSVVGYAGRARSAVDVRRVSGALRRLARDPRLGVRGAAAYGGTKLQTADVADEICSVAEELDKAMLEETYALIQRQRCFGELDRDHP